ncbi:MAG: heme exporter protein CcmB [Chloroflexi bacterium]|nr:heme exporter protein CcmB [Chloroflexota bacterium]
MDPEREGSAWRQDLVTFAAQVWAIVWKDIVLELRRREVLMAMATFALLALIVFTFALDLAAEHAAAVAPGALWVAYLFAGTIGLGRAFALEREWGTLEGLLLAPVERPALYLAKMLSITILMLAVEAASLVLFTVFFNLPVLRLSLVPVLLLGTVGFAAAGTLFAAMAANTRAREVLLPVLLFPITVPVVIASVKATAGAIDGSGPGAWLQLLIAFDAVILVVGLWVAGAVLED